MADDALGLTSGVAHGGRLYVTTMEPEYRDASWLVEVGAESVTRLLVDTSIVEVHEMAVFEETLMLSAADDDGRHHRSSDDAIALAATTDQFEVIRLAGSDAANYGHDNAQASAEGSATPERVGRVSGAPPCASTDGMSERRYAGS
jgi:hypothetical protein